MDTDQANKIWGEGNWIHHEGCGTHHVDFHKSRKEQQRGTSMSHEMKVSTDGGVLRAMMMEVYFVNEEKGWYEADRTFGDDIALLHSEVSEMLEAFREFGIADATSTEFEWAKPEGVGSEAADVLVRLLDTCKRYDIDLFAEWRRKVDFNRTRPTRHGGKTL